jgi:hypothetical protein
MKVIIETEYPIRDSKISTYHSFPVFSDDIEKTLVRQLDFLKNYEEFSLSFRVVKNKP